MRQRSKSLFRRFGELFQPASRDRWLKRPLATESLEHRMLLAGDFVNIRLEVTDFDDNALTSVNEGGDFYLRGYLQDTRNDPAANAGLFSGFLDIEYDQSVLADQGTYQTISPYTNPLSGNWQFQPGEIQNAGAYTTLQSYAGGGEYHIFRVPFTAFSAPFTANNDSVATDPELLIPAGALPHVLDVMANDTYGGSTTLQGTPVADSSKGGYPTFVQDRVDLDPPNEDWKYSDPIAPADISYGQSTLDIIPTNTLFISNVGPTANVSASNLSDKGGALQIVNGGQQVSYTPPASMNNLAAGETETDTFRYNISNGRGQPRSAVVTVTVTGSADVRYDLTIKPVRTTVTSNTGEIAQLPASREWLDEWDTYWVEIWVSTPLTNNVGVASASVDLSYDTTYHTANAAIEYGPGFTPVGQVTIDDPNGRVLNISANTSAANVGDNVFALLARVPFARKASDAQVPLNADNQYMSAVAELTTELSRYEATLVGQATPTVETGFPLNVDLWPVMYDLDDDQSIGFEDFSFFAFVFLSQVEPGDGSYGSDFDHSGTVDFGDFSFFAPNFGGGPSRARVYPPGFPEQWEGQNLTVLADTAPLGEPAGLSQEELAPVVNEAVTRLAVAGRQAARLDDVTFEIVDLPGDLLGRAYDNLVQLDLDAAGYGWFVDTTPGDDLEFAAFGSAYELAASVDSPAAGRVDLLTVVAHELAHLLGHDDDNGHTLMESLLPVGARRLVDPNPAAPVDAATLDNIFADMR